MKLESYSKSVLADVLDLHLSVTLGQRQLILQTKLENQDANQPEIHASYSSTMHQK